MTDRWDEIDRRLGLRNTEGIARNIIEPLLRDVAAEPASKDGTPVRVQGPLTVAFLGFLLTFFITANVLPDNLIGEILQFFLFPLLFLGCVAGAIYVYKDRFIGLFMAGRDRFIIRSRALSAIAERLSLTYIPAPGGAPKLLNVFARQKFAPKEVREIVEFLDDHGGMDDALDDARRSGVMAPDLIVLAKKEQKQKYLKQQSDYAQVEDGFQGVRNGVAFSAFEWVETVEDAADIHHLALVMEAPTRLYSVTQFRSKGAAWPSAARADEMKPVGLGVSAFEKRFRLRSTDQVEARVIFNPTVIERAIALAHEEKLRAVAFENRLIFDVAGEDRFALVDLTTGAWDQDSIARTFLNLAEMLELVDAVADAFLIRRKSA